MPVSTKWTYNLYIIGGLEHALFSYRGRRAWVGQMPSEINFVGSESRLDALYSVECFRDRASQPLKRSIDRNMRFDYEFSWKCLNDKFCGIVNLTRGLGFAYKKVKVNCFGLRGHP